MLVLRTSNFQLRGNYQNDNSETNTLLSFGGGTREGCFDVTRHDLSTNYNNSVTFQAALKP